MARWYTCATSVAHRPRWLMCAMPPSPSTSLMSVAPPMRQAFPPNSSGAMSNAVAISLAKVRDCVELHARPSGARNIGSWPDPPWPARSRAPLSSHRMRSASYAQSGSLPAGPCILRLRRGVGTALFLASPSLIPTTRMIAHSCPSLDADGRIQSTELHVRSRAASNSRSSGLPISPPRSNKLCARSAAVHSIRRCGDSCHSPLSASCRIWCARSPLLSFRDPVGGSS
eukprot:372533-Pleurochrysis_carterae.AAC.2